jgi:hypothetical protein
MAQAEIQCGPHRVVSLMSTEVVKHRYRHARTLTPATAT